MGMKSLFFVIIAILGLVAARSWATADWSEAEGGVSLGGTLELPKLAAGAGSAEAGVCTYALVEEHSVVGTRCPSAEVMTGKDEARLPHLLRCAKLRIVCPINNCY